MNKVGQVCAQKQLFRTMFCVSLLCIVLVAILHLNFPEPVRSANLSDKQWAIQQSKYLWKGEWIIVLSLIGVSSFAIGCWRRVDQRKKGF
jgi:hypothetical protein